MIPKYSEIKNQIKIDIPTGRAIIPDLEFEDHNNIRTPDMADFNDNMAVKNLYRRLLVIDAMNTIIRNANNENISLGDWLYFVDDGSKGLDFYNYVGKVVDNIARVSGCNSFKIANAIKFKDTDEDKYDLRLFWKAFISICMDRLLEDKQRYTYGIQVTSKYMQELSITGINKQSTVDCWVLDIRKGWM